MGRIAAIDFGMKRIGLALSDERKVLALPTTVLPTQKTLEATVKALLEALSAYGPLETIVVGLPLHLNGKESPMSALVREFAKLLETRSQIRTVLLDERLTSALAERSLKEHLNRKKRSEVVDAIAACSLLQSFLDSQPSKTL